MQNEQCALPLYICCELGCADFGVSAFVCCLSSLLRSQHFGEVFTSTGTYFMCLAQTVNFNSVKVKPQLQP